MKKIVPILTVALAFSGCTTPSPTAGPSPAGYQTTAEKSHYKWRKPAAVSDYELLRGNPGEYDPGAPAGSKWVELYASAPNYREIGKAILGGKDEKFRWEMGPMWYRGRLGQNQVKAFIVGQEGAQDENVSNRAFTGSTGTKTQAFLNHIGVYRSYLFMNTFVYTINGQLDGTNPKFAFLEQGHGTDDVEDSPIVQYRHRLFDNMLVQNAGSIALFMGVGSGGKASLATWINARGGECSTAKDMDQCDTSGMVEYFRKGFTASYGERIKANLAEGTQIVVIGVPHPGGASQANGGADALANIVRGFTKAAQKVAAAKNADKEWLPQDQDDPLDFKARIAKMNAKFEYKDAGVPYRDFAFGTNKQMGATGTTSNRWKADSIQVFSKLGVYGDKSADYRASDKTVGKFDYTKSNIESAGFIAGSDMPWEPPRWNGEDSLATAYDPGPCGEYDNHEFFSSQDYEDAPCALAGMMMTGWNSTKEAQSASFGPTSIYRGRLKGTKILVIADQTSHDDFFSGRALTGETGQKLQTWLNEQNVDGKYAIIRTSAWDALNTDGSLNESILQGSEDHLNEILNEVVKRNKPQLVVGLGAWAQQVAEAFAKSKGIEYKALDVSRQALSPIPREDLPYHSRWWMGTSGNRAARGEGGGLKPGRTADGAFHYYRVYAPTWNSRYAVPKLDKAVLNKINSSVGALR